MKKRRLMGYGKGGSDERAVSSIIGGILFLTIIIVAFVNFRVAVVPALDEQREAAHMSVVADRISSIKGEADRQVDKEGRPTVATAVPLKPQRGSSFLSDGTMASYLSFAPDATDVTLESKELLIQVDNGTAVFGPDETWTEITSGETLANVSQVQHLRVRIEDPQSQNDDDNVTVTVWDAEGVYAGDLKVYITTHPSGYSVNTRVRDGDNDTLYDQGESAFNQDRPPFFWVDGLADEVQFGDVLQAAEGPITLEFTKNGMNGAFTIVYLEDTEVGTILVGGAGKKYTDWSRHENGGTLMYRSHNVRFIEQDLYMEAGAVVLEQPVGNTFLVEPNLDVEHSGNRTVVRVTVPALQGSAEAHSGSDPVSVRVQGLTRHAITGTAPHFGFNVTTRFPSVWLAYWNSTFAGAGFTEAAGELNLTNGTDWARFDFYGKETDPASLEHDLALQMHTGKVQVVMRG